MRWSHTCCVQALLTQLYEYVFKWICLHWNMDYRNFLMECMSAKRVFFQCNNLTYTEKWLGNQVGLHKRRLCSKDKQTKPKLSPHYSIHDSDCYCCQNTFTKRSCCPCGGQFFSSDFSNLSQKYYVSKILSFNSKANPIPIHNAHIVHIMLDGRFHLTVSVCRVFISN